MDPGNVRGNSEESGDGRIQGAVVLLQWKQFTEKRRPLLAMASRHFENLGKNGCRQNRIRIKMAPIFIRRTVPATDPILFAEDGLPEETAAGAELRPSARCARSARLCPLPPRAALGSRFGSSAKPQNLGWERRTRQI
jgi:hypothetical protein